MGFSHKQKAQLIRIILEHPRVNIQHLSVPKGLLKVTLIMWLSATLKQKQKNYMRAILR